MLKIGPPYGAAAREREVQPLGDEWTVGLQPRQRDVDGREFLGMLAEDTGDLAGERYVPFLSTLRRTEDELPVDDLHLVRDVEPSGIEPDMFLGQSEDLALAETAAAADVDHRLIALRERGAHGEHPV